MIFLFSGSSKPRFLDGAQLETWTVQAGEDESNACPRCNGKVFEAEKMISMRHVYHKKCFTCHECSRPMDQFIACDAPDGKQSTFLLSSFFIIFIKFLSRFALKKKKARSNSTLKKKQKYSLGNNVKHIAFEAKASLYFSYSIQGEVVCRTCYTKKYSCSAFTLSGADMLKLLDTTTILGSDADKDACPRCLGRVFHAEKVEVKDKAYHKKCACCFNCSKPLSSRDLCEGKDGNIFCSSCYSRKFGAPGYRGILIKELIFFKRQTIRLN